MCRATVKNTAKERCMIDRYNRSTCHTIYEAYKNPSEQKKALYDYYLSECCRRNGHDFRVISYNAFYVTFAYIVQNYLVVITPSRKMVIECETN